MNEVRRHKAVFASDDGGASWLEVGDVTPMFWPTVFAAASGVYVIGVNRPHTPDNQLCVSKMLDADGAVWSAPANITTGLGAVSGNTGVDVSAGRVLKTFEINPSMAARPARTRLTRGAELALPRAGGGDGGLAAPPMEVAVEEAAPFIEYTMVQVRAAPG
jgi:hypothetical protein